MRPATVVYRPDWWDDAVCRGTGPGMWIAERGKYLAICELRAMCARCPVAGNCLRDALTEPIHERAVGPMRAGVTGVRPWKAVRLLVEEMQPTTDADWDVVAAWVLDDYPAVIRGVRRPPTVTAQQPPTEQPTEPPWEPPWALGATA